MNNQPCGLGNCRTSVKGDAIVIFAILKDGHEPSAEIKSGIKDCIRREVGPIAIPDDVYLVSKLPKTRSGKIMRRVIRAVASGLSVGDVTTLEDEGAIEELNRAYEELQKEL